MVFCEDAVQVLQCSLLTVTCLHLDDVQVPYMCLLWVVHDRCRVQRTGIAYVLVCSGFVFCDGDVQVLYVYSIFLRHVVPAQV